MQLPGRSGEVIDTAVIWESLSWLPTVEAIVSQALAEVKTRLTSAAECFKYHNNTELPAPWENMPHHILSIGNNEKRRAALKRWGSSLWITSLCVRREVEEERNTMKCVGGGWGELIL